MTQDVDGVVGQACEFDGNDDFVEIPHSDSLNLSDEDGVTMSMWVKGASGGSYARVLEKGENQAYEMLSDNGSGNLSPWVRINGGDLHRGSIDSLTTDEWHHLVATYDAATGESKFYVDGELKNTDSISPQNINNAGETLRIATEEPLSGGDKVGGKIDEVRVYNRPTPQATIQIIYNKTKP